MQFSISLNSLLINVVAPENNARVDVGDSSTDNTYSLLDFLSAHQLHRICATAFVLRFVFVLASA